MEEARRAALGAFAGNPPIGPPNPAFPWGLMGPYGAMSMPTGPYIPPFPAGTVTPTGKVVAPLQIFNSTTRWTNWPTDAALAGMLIVNISDTINAKFGDAARGLPYDIESFKIGVTIDFGATDVLAVTDVLWRVIFLLIPMGFDKPGGVKVFDSDHPFSPVNKDVIFFQQCDLTAQGPSFAIYGHGRGRGFVEDRTASRPFSAFPSIANTMNIGGGGSGLYMCIVPMGDAAIRMKPVQYALGATIRLAKEAALVRGPQVLTGPTRSLTISIKEGLAFALNASIPEVTAMRVYPNKFGVRRRKRQTAGRKQVRRRKKVSASTVTEPKRHKKKTKKAKKHRAKKVKRTLKSVARRVRKAVRKARRVAGHMKTTKIKHGKLKGVTVIRDKKGRIVRWKGHRKGGKMKKSKH